MYLSNQGQQAGRCVSALASRLGLHTEQQRSAAHCNAVQRRGRPQTRPIVTLPHSYWTSRAPAGPHRHPRSPPRPPRPPRPRPAPPRHQCHQCRRLPPPPRPTPGGRPQCPQGGRQALQGSRTAVPRLPSTNWHKCTTVRFALGLQMVVVHHPRRGQTSWGRRRGGGGSNVLFGGPEIL